MKETVLDSILSGVDDPSEREMLQQTWDRLAELERAEPSPELARRFARMVEFSQAATPRSPSFLRRLVPVAAALVVGTTIGAIAVRYATVPGDDGVPVAASRVHADRLSRAVSAVFQEHPLASWRLEAVETLAALPEDPEIGRILTEVATSDPSIGVRLVAIDAVGPYATDEEVTQRLIQTVQKTDSTLVRIRLIELFVDQRIDAARPEIESLHRDPGVDELVRTSARWAIERL